ncbi:TonB-dependent siderophore receptor [Erythrobacter sp. YT30]|uniref:TonB-dependent receptor plug domain-containing protein n=1 Tax=Erythrobacter sp. YT30 TaxID=1735012 RepID=UPI00076C1868|nr:TonB-dependent receptor [Erythrobacter sp. YT30]KWV90363.1 TonB-dependent receptor [Erythrobacter sp. YT30]
MKKTTQLRLSVGSVAVGLALAATPSFAQDADVTEEEEASVSSEGIIVTGSRVTDPNLLLSSPVAAVGEEELTLRQTNVAEQFLRELPGAVSSIGAQVNNGNGGASFVNLRGIGSVRNLVLLDGRRFVPADETGRVDLNNIPLAIIERTDILTGGATTTYGADAVSGVVNFITKKDFAGVQADFTSQITEEGDGELFRAELTLGANFDDGRGNAVLSIGYQDQSAVFQGDRDFSVFNVSSFSGNPGGSSNSVPGNFVFTGPTNPATVCDMMVFPDEANCPAGTSFAGEPFGTVTGQINNDGTDITPGVNSGAGPFNFNPFNIFQTPFERYNIYGAANYEINDNVELYSQAVFSKQTVSTIIAPGGSFFNTYQLNLNNPLLPDAIAQRFGDALGLSAAEFTAARNTQFGPTLADGSQNPDYVQFGTQIRRRTVEIGTRDSDFTTTLFNIVVGARGNITDSIEYDLFATYGESERIQRQSGFARLSRLQQALLAIPDGSGGAVCIDPSSGCAPVDLFGPAGDLGSQASQDFAFNLTQQVIDTSSIGTVQGTVFGDLPITLFAETPVNFAVGAEYREFTTSQFADEASQSGQVVGGGAADPNFDGSYDVFDVYGELIIPIVEGASFAEQLTLDLGARYSNYELSSNEFTWKVGATWEPVPGFSIRGNFQRAARAPNIGELFFPVITGLDNLALDPCAGNAPTADPALAAVCIAQGAPAAIVNAGLINQPPAGQINTTTGGNLQLDTEQAETWTLGFIAQPDFLPGLTFTVDYFNISIEDAIGSPAIGDIIGGCYQSGNLDFNTNEFCQLVVRSSTTGEIAGAVNEVPGLIQNLTNLGVIETDGIDVRLNYGTELTDNISLNLNFEGTWTNSNTFQAIAGDPNSVVRDCVGFYSVNCGNSAGEIQPEFVFNQRTTLNFFDDYSLSLRWRFLSGVDYEPLQFQAELDAAEADPDGCPDPLGADPGGCIVQEEFRSIPSESYFDLTFQWDVMENLLFTLTATNVFDNKPTIVGSNIGTTAFNSGNIYPSTYDPLGRRYSASVRLSF